MSSISYIKETNTYVFSCPHCQGVIAVKKCDINCKIFRHGIYKKNGRCINSHLPKTKCEKLLKQGKILGCAKPFKFDGSVVEVCDYI